MGDQNKVLKVLRSCYEIYLIFCMFSDIEKVTNVNIKKLEMTGKVFFLVKNPCFGVFGKKEFNIDPKCGFSSFFENQHVKFFPIFLRFWGP